LSQYGSESLKALTKAPFQWQADVIGLQEVAKQNDGNAQMIITPMLSFMN
jgi:hypothetical protein